MIFQSKRVIIKLRCFTYALTIIKTIPKANLYHKDTLDFLMLMDEISENLTFALVSGKHLKKKANQKHPINR